MIVVGKDGRLKLSLGLTLNDEVKQYRLRKNYEIIFILKGIKKSKYDSIISSLPDFFRINCFLSQSMCHKLNT